LAPIQELAVPHLYNLTVNPDEDTPLNYDTPSSWVVGKIFTTKTQELLASLKHDSVPYMAPLDYNPYGTRPAHT
jgi:hypothetical protein